MNLCRRLLIGGAAMVLLWSCETPADPPPFSRLAWQDEFEGTAVNEADWTFETGAGGWGNNEWQTYKKENSAVQPIPGEASRALVISARSDGAGGYTSSRLKTQGKRSFTFGRIEARLKLPQGQGIWPAFWMLGESISSEGWPKCSELDIMEMVGGDPALQDKDVNNRTTVGTLHWWGTGHAYRGKSYTLPTRLSEGFHVYGVEWSASQIRWLVDGVEYQRQNISAADMDEFRRPAFLLLNLAVGGNWPGYPDASTVFPQEYWIDWIRVYQ